MMKLYANENFPKPVVLLLRQLGYDILTSYEADQANQQIPDDQVLLFAFKQGRLVITENRKDFIKLHKQGIPHKGIIVCTADRDFESYAARIHEFLSITPSFEDQLFRIKKSNF
jgi:uncharacterized protein with PIN domain